MSKTTWSIDKSHAEIRFRIRHLMVSWVTGTFQQFDVKLEMEGHDITTADIHFTARVSSISTNNEQRDTHLRSGDFFDAAHHPLLVFQSSAIKKVNEDEYEMQGMLTMRGLSQAISLQIEFGGIILDPQGNTRMGLSMAGKVNRNDYGITFSRLSETGEKLLGETVSIIGSAEFLEG
ncbi:YceI family protein [Chitinophaga sancti]|uniref:YceI family protein n=1 Tax=Chitinophaga sancti TaxID=1004 RepID=UPI003F7B017E